MSPTTNTGTPRRASRASGFRYGLISGRRVSRSSFSTARAEPPSRTSSGPYGVAVRCTFAIATTWSRSTAAYAIRTPPTRAANSG